MIEHFGQYLKSLRELKRLTLRDVETLAKNEITNGYLSQIETGRVDSPSIKTFVILAKVYGVPPIKLIELFIDHTIDLKAMEGEG